MRPEISVDHKYFMENIEKLGWKNITNSYPDLKEHSISSSYIIEEELDKKIREINRDIFDKLSNNSINKILNEIKRKIQNSTLSEFSNYIKHGITVENPEDPSNLLNIKLIDYNNIYKNSFIYAHELKFKGNNIIEPDFTLFINGIPLILAEIKSEKSPDSEYEALDQLSRYEEEVPELAKMVHIGLAIGMKKGYAPMFPNYDHKSREKNLQVWKIDGQDDIYNLLNPSILLNFIKYYVFIIKSDNNYYRIAARYNQYRAAEKSFSRIKEYLDRKSNKNRGLIWHWLGSGKTYTMFFIAYKFLLNYSDRNPIIFIVVDRQDLEKQHLDIISKIDDQLLTQYKNITKINSISELHNLIRQIRESEFSIGKNTPRGIYIVTMQKFQKGDLENEERKGIINLLCELKDEYLENLKITNLQKYNEIAEKLSKLNDKEKIEECFKMGAPNKKEILFLIDEAHRSQYGRLASVRKLAFPNAINIGFTGTPILNTDNRNTLEEFSYPDLNEYYLDAYFISDSISDGFTLPIVYKSIKEGKDGIKFQLDENEIEKYIEEYSKREKEGEEDISEYFEQDTINISDKQLRNIINEIKVFLLNPKRIDALAKYITEHVLEDTQTVDINDKSKYLDSTIPKFRFKAMIVTANRRACVLMKRYLDKHLIETFGEQAKNWSEIVMTYNYNEKDPDIKQYMEELRNKYKSNDFDAINSEIIDNFKNLPDPRILIVTDMLITGFDAPQLRVMYLDKPIYSHKLLQAIGRVNRPAPGKKTGLVVDSIGLLPNLKKTLIKYNELLSKQNNINIEKELEITLKDESTEENSFKEYLEKVKNKLKLLNINGEDLSIDLDELKNDIKSTENWINKYEDKIRKISFYYYFNKLNSIENKDLLEQIIKLKVTVNNLISVVKFYNSLSPYNAASSKILYKDDIDAIKILLRLITGPLGKTTKSTNKLLNEILDLIYSKTKIEQFEEDESAIINDKVLEKMAEISEKEIKNKAYTYFLVIRKKIEEDVDIDPFYKKVAETLNKLEEYWIAKKQNTKDILQQLKTIYEQITKYSEDRNKMNDIDKILYSIRLALTEEYGESCKEINFNKLSDFLNKIKDMIKNKSFKDAKYIIDSKESELEKQLKIDILRNCKNIKIEDIDRYIKNELVEKIKDQIIRWLYENDSQNRY
jgi:type I restriction enzyme R subunit